MFFFSYKRNYYCEPIATKKGYERSVSLISLGTIYVEVKFQLRIKLARSDRSQK